jgi:hypothetical protein
MINMDSLNSSRIKESELLKAADTMRSDVISMQELDEPIALHIHSDLGPDNTKVVDASDKPVIKIICRNESLAGDQHPVTGVPFEGKVIEVNGQCYEGVFPQFEHDFKTTLPEEMHIASDREQFAQCNKELKEKIASNSDLRDSFTPEQIEQIENGDRPEGYVWHHAENPGEMQLIKKEEHDLTGHTGGKVFWGGGNENR